jgi:hypothetical protein
MTRNIGFAWLFFAGALLTLAQGTGTTGQLVITMGHYYGSAAPTLTRADLMVTRDGNPVAITNLIPLRGDLELFVMVDNCSNCEAGLKLEELRRFLNSQPPTTAVGVASIDGGHLHVLQNPAPDHALAIQALSLPTGSKPSSPFSAISELIQSWPRNTARRAVLLISNGIDPTASELYQSQSAETAIATAQRAGVTIYALYHPSADYLNSDFSELYTGQVLLAHLASETGGEAYFVGFGPLPSLSPMLADVSEHLQNQYLLEFVAAPGEYPGALQEINVKCKVSNVDLMAPRNAWIPGRAAGPSDGEAKRP